MTHLTPDEIVDAVEGALVRARQVHLESCGACRGSVERLGLVLRQVRAADMPEPSPLFWDRLSARVRVAIAVEAAPPARSQWLTWPVLAPLAGLALLVVALGAALPRDAGRSERALLTASAAADAEPASDAAWALAAELVAQLDVEGAQEAGIMALPGSADLAAWHLSADEQVELLRLLQQEVGRSGG